MKHPITYFAPAPAPDPTLDDRAYAAVHARQVRPTAAFEFELVNLMHACHGAACVGRKGDAGYIVACAVEGTRSNASSSPASLAIVDWDDSPPDWAALAEYEGFGWTTASHGLPGPDGTPRQAWRFLIPFESPAAHGQLPSPWPGAHIRARSQPAFLPTHRIDVNLIEWRWLGGTKRLAAPAAAPATPLVTGRDSSLLAAVFEAAGWVEREQSGGLVVRCPWVHEHSDGEPGGTVVLHDDPDGSGLGKFHCSRTKCAAAQRTSWQALDALRGVPAVAVELAEWRETLDGWVRGAPVFEPPSDPKGDDEVPRPGAPAAVPPVQGAAELEQPDPDLITSEERWLDWMNSQYCVLTAIGNRVRVFSWGPSPLRPEWRTPVVQTFDDLKNRLLPLRARIEGMLDEEGRPKSVAVAPWWLFNPGRREAATLTFAPEHPTASIVHGALNIWRGYGVAPAPGDWSRTFALVQDVVANGDTQSVQYIIRWMAWVLQNPGRQAEVALVLRGAKGTGKNTLLDALCHLFGQHAKVISSPRHLTGNFNAHLQDCALLFANEAIPPNDKAAESILKALVTDRHMMVERKGVDAEQSRNYLSICMASNEQWCVPAGLDERRFAVFDVSDLHKQDSGYFAAIHAELQAGGYAAMLHDLLSLDLKGWHPRQDVPKTRALVEQQLHGLRGADRVVYLMLDAGENLGALETSKVEPTRALAGSEAIAGGVFVATVKAIERSKVNITAKQLGAAIRAAGGVSDQPQVTLFGRAERQRGWWLPRLETARVAWCEAMGVQVVWSDADGWR